MNNKRLHTLGVSNQYHILSIRSGMQLELHEKVGEGSSQRIWKMKGLVIKVKRPNHIDGTFTIRGKTSGVTIEKIYPMSFPAFDKVLLLDTFKIRRAKLYYLRDKVGKDARLKSLITADERGMDLLVLAKATLEEQTKILEDVVTNDVIVETAVVHADILNEENIIVGEETIEIATVTDTNGDTVTVVQDVVEIYESQDVVEAKVETTEHESQDTVESVTTDLIDINGIGPSFAARLTSFGISSIALLAEISDEKIQEIEAQDSMTSMEEWNNWRSQAKAMVA